MSEVEISPLARRLAEENNVDWRSLSGSGENGKVVERDVLDYLARVMSGDEDLDPTPEPLPEGMESWSEAGPAAAGHGSAGPAASSIRQGHSEDTFAADRYSAEDDDLLLDTDVGDELGTGSDSAPAPAGQRPGAAPAEEVELDEDIFVFDDDDPHEGAAAAPRENARSGGDTEDGFAGDDFFSLHDEEFTSDERETFSWDEGGDEQPAAAAEGTWRDRPEPTESAAEREYGLDAESYLADRDGGAEEFDGPEYDTAADGDEPEWKPASEPATDRAASSEPASDWAASSEPASDWAAGSESPADWAAASEPSSDWVGGSEAAPEWAAEDESTDGEASRGWGAADDSPSSWEQQSHSAAEQTAPWDREVAAEVEEPEQPHGQHVTDQLPAEGQDFPAAPPSASPTSFEARHDERAASDEGASEEPAEAEATERWSASEEPPRHETTRAETTPMRPETDDRQAIGPAPAAAARGSHVATTGIVLRRDVDLTNLAAAQAAVGHELGTTDPIAPAAFLLRAALRAGHPWPLADGATAVLAALTDQGVEATAIAHAADMPFRDLVAACRTTPKGAVPHEAALVVADLSVLGIDEAVLDLGRPVLALGRVLQRGDGSAYRGTLTLSGPVAPDAGARFLARVVELLDAPVRLVL